MKSNRQPVMIDANLYKRLQEYSAPTDAPVARVVSRALTEWLDTVGAARLEAQPTPLDPANILTVEELAARLKVPRTWVYEHLRARAGKTIPAFRCGRYLRFDWLEVAAWLRERR